MHDPRVGRFFARDPLEAKYPMLTPYQFSANTPIMAVELEGLESSNDPNPTQNFDTEMNANKFGLGDYAQSTDFMGRPTGIPIQIQLDAIEVVGQVKSKTASWTSESTNGQFTNTQSMESYIAQYGADAAKNYSANDYRNFLKSATRDRWTEEQVAAFSANYKAGFQNWDPNGIGAFWMNTTAYAVGGSLLAVGGAPIIGELGAKYGLFSFSTKGAGLRMLNETATEYFANGEVGKINWVAVGASSFKLNLASDYLGSQFSYTINKGVEFNTFNKMGANFGVTQANRILGIGATKISSQPSFNNTMDKITTHGLSIGFQSFLKYQTNEIE